VESGGGLGLTSRGKWRDRRATVSSLGGKIHSTSNSDNFGRANFDWDNVRLNVG